MDCLSRIRNQSLLRFLLLYSCNNKMPQSTKKECKQYSSPIQNDFKRNLWIACCEFVTSPSYGSYFYILAIMKCHRAQKKNANSPPLLCFLSCFNAVDKKILRQDVTARKTDRMWCNQSFVAIFRIFQPPSFRIIRILNFNVTIMKTC